jgi:hypothetical protein
MFGFPLLLIPLAIFNIIVFLMPGVDFAAPAFAVALMSGTTWSVTFGDIVLTAGMALLLCEIVKVARAGGRYFVDHLLSFIVLAAAVAELVWLAPFGNSTFFLLCALAFVDFVAGIALHRRRSRTAPAATVAPPLPVPPPPTVEPRVEPVVASVPPPAPVSPAASPAATAPAPESEPSLGSLVPGVAASPAADASPADGPSPADRTPATPDRPVPGSPHAQP